MKYLHSALAVASLVLTSTAIASAHVIVTPGQVGVAATQTFSVSVPSEKDGLTATSVRLVIPGGLQQVNPTVQAGWKIYLKTDSSSNVTEITWSGTAIPAGQRADLTFRAQAPATAQELDWKAYQTYSDGSVVSWDQTPVPGHETDDSMTPYSKTVVVNDLTTPSPSKQADPVARWFSSFAVVFSLIGLGLAIRRSRS